MLLWLGFVAVLSLLPLSVKQDLGTTGALHGWGHVVIFAITTILFARGAAGLALRLVRSVAVILFGVLLELLQHAIYHNRFEWRDVAADALGVLIGLTLAITV